MVDGTDNFQTRYLVNDACVLLCKPNVYGSIYRFEGQASVFATKNAPCYRCLFREPPPPGLVPSCAEGGVLGGLPGSIGTKWSSRRRVVVGASTASPAATVRIAVSRSAGGVSFSRKPLAPARSPSKTYRSLSNVVGISTRPGGSALVIG